MIARSKKAHSCSCPQLCLYIFCPLPPHLYYVHDRKQETAEAYAVHGVSHLSSNPSTEAPRRRGTRSSRDYRLTNDAAYVWETVSRSPLQNLWDFQGISPMVVFRRAGTAFLDDNLVSRAAELGYYFLFALFPTLVFCSSILGMLAQRTSTVYLAMLNYLSLVIPPSAFHMVLSTFNQTTAASSGGKITFGLAVAVWSASVGFGSIQDTANIVYKVKETRPYWKAKLQAIGVTFLLSVDVIATLGVLLLTDYLTKRLWLAAVNHYALLAAVVMLKLVSWVLVTALLILLFALLYYFAPDLKTKCWRWLTPGSAIAIFFWLLASIVLRVYLHYFNSFSQTYGSLGAVIILLTWFYVTGLTLLAGAEVNSEIQAAVIERQLKAAGELSPEISAEPGAPPV
jgi:membrane protein